MTDTTVTMSVAEFDRMRDEIKALNEQLDSIDQELNDAVESHVPFERRKNLRTGYSLVRLLLEEIEVSRFDKARDEILNRRNEG